MRLKFLLRPGWIGMILLVVVFASLCYTVLAPWQFRRDQENQAQNTAIEQSLTAPPKPLAEVLPGNRAPDERTQWTKVTFTGHYLPQGETVAWQRTVQGEPAFEILTPFRLTDGTTLLVDRGYIGQGASATQTPPYPPAPTGEVTLTARARTDEYDSDQRPVFLRDGQRWTYAVASHTIAQGTGIPLRPGYFALVDGQPGVLNSLPLPQIDTGPYFSYALQWIAFGTMAIFAIAYLIHTELNPQKRPTYPIQPQDEEPSAGPTAEPEPADQSSTPPADEPPTSQPSTPPRYGAPKTKRPTTRPKRPWRRRMSVAQAIAEEERREREQATRD